MGREGPWDGLERFSFSGASPPGVTPPSRHRPYERGVRPRAPMKKEERVAGIEPALVHVLDCAKTELNRVE